MTDDTLLALDDVSLVHTLTDYAIRLGAFVHTDVPSPLVARAVKDAEDEILRRLSQASVCDHG